MASVQKIHIGESLCVLCRQAAMTGSHLLDLDQNLFTALRCKNPCARCSQTPYPSIWFHPKCYNVLENSYQPSKKPTSEDLERFAHASRPVYECQPEEHREMASVMEGLFSKYTTKIIQDCFRQDLFRQLPLEIVMMISKLIAPCWYLIVLGETRRLIECLRDNRETHRNVWLRLTPEMWLSRINYRGNSYVARLSDKPLESTGTSFQCPIYLPSNISKIVLSVDCIGVRGIQFLDDDSEPISDGSPWYEILDARDSELKAYARCDGLFTRRFQLVSGEPSFEHRFWSTPFPPKFQPWNFYQVLERFRLDYLKFASHIRGLLVCCANGKTLGIHGVSDTSTKFREFVNLVNRRISDSYKHWIYFPFNEREYIKAAWIRKLRICRGPASSPILVLQTSLGRTVTFGPHLPTRIIDQYEYQPLVRNGDGAISGIFHNGLDPDFNCISEFGVTCNDNYHAGPIEPPPMDTRFEPPAVPPGRGSISCTWYMTKAPLKGIVKVQVCRDEEQSHHPCLGLLLFYSDQHVEAIGQVRWDYDLTQETSRPMYVVHGAVDGREYIKDIRSDIPGPELDEEFGGQQKLPENGIIAWWFSQLGDRIITYD